MRLYGDKENKGGVPDSNSATKYGAGEVTSLRRESKNAVSRAGLTLAPQDGTGETFEQLAESMMITGMSARAFQDSGAADAIVLTPVTGASGLKLPPDFTTLDGGEVSFFAAFTTLTTTPTASIGQTGGTQFGAKTIVMEDGSALVVGDINTAVLTVLKRDGATDKWLLIRGKGTEGNDGTVTSVATGTGLTGGPITGTGTISIAAGGVNTTQIADNAVTLAKMAGLTAGNLIAGDSGGNPAAVTTGTSGQILTSNGVGAAPTMQDGVVVGLVPLDTITAASSATVDLTMAITTAFNDFLITISGIRPGTDNTELFMRVSTDGGSSFDSTAIYEHTSRGLLSNGGALTTANANAGLELRIVSGAHQGMGNGAEETGSFNVRLSRPGDGGVQTQIFFDGGYRDNNGFQNAIFAGTGRYKSTTGVNAVQFLMSSGVIIKGDFNLYGIKKPT